MFILIDDRIFNTADISFIEPDVDENQITIFYRSTPDTTTSVHYESTEKLIEGLQALVNALEPKEIPGTVGDF